jgi:hypothetical protein
MKISDIASRIHEAALMQRLPRWDLETEIDVLRARFSEILTRDGSIFLSALKRSEEVECAPVEVSLFELFGSMSPGSRDCFDALEAALFEVVCAEGVESEESGSFGSRHVFAMDMIMEEGEKTAFLQAGADVKIIFQPEADLLARVVIEVRPMVDQGYDMTVFEKRSTRSNLRIGLPDLSFSRLMIRPKTV